MKAADPHGNQTSASRPTATRLNQGNRPHALCGWGKGWKKTGEANRFPENMNSVLLESFLRTMTEILDSLQWKSHLTTSRLEAVVFVKVYFNQRKSCFPSSTGNSPEMHGRLRSAVRIQALFNLRIKKMDVYKVY